MVQSECSGMDRVLDAAQMLLRRPLDVVQTVYFTIYYSLSWVSEELPETARCCSDRIFYNELFTFLGLEGAP